MKVFTVAVVLTILCSALAERDYCPHPEEAGEELVNEFIKLDAPIAGHSALEIDLSSRITGRDLACFTYVMQRDSSSLHIISFGKNKGGGFSVKVYGEEKKALIAVMQAYAVGKRPTAATTQKPTTQQPFPSIPAF